MRFRLLSRVVAPAAAVATLFTSPDASAFCRSTTCEEDQVCRADRRGCTIDGDVLYRTSSCVSFSVQEDASPRHGIDAETLERLTQDAFDRWTQADCGGGQNPSIRVESFGTVECGAVEYSSDQGNANIVVFRDDEWPADLDSRAFALTTVSFETTNGEIYDADMEINGTIAGTITYSEPEDGVDLPSILTHEVGHFLGLDHSLEAGAVMRASYDVMVDNLRVLGTDDIEGICTVYPPDRDTQSNRCEPRHGFQSSCATLGASLNAAGSCSFELPSRAGAASAAWISALAGVTAVMALRRRRRQTLAGG